MENHIPTYGMTFAVNGFSDSTICTCETIRRTDQHNLEMRLQDLNVGKRLGSGIVDGVEVGQDRGLPGRVGLQHEQHSLDRWWLSMRSTKIMEKQPWQPPFLSWVLCT